MLLQISRKQEFNRLLLESDRTAQPLFDISEMKSLISKPNNLIGKDIVLIDQRNPLDGGSSKTTVDLKTMCEKFKLYIESLCNIDD